MSPLNSQCQIRCLRTQQWIAEQGRVAHSFWSRLKGLIGEKDWSFSQALLLSPCRDIHMWMMRMPIDVIFLKKISLFQQGAIYQITSMHSDLKPWKLWPVVDFQASDALELPVGSILKHNIHIGDQLCINFL